MMAAKEPDRNMPGMRDVCLLFEFDFIASCPLDSGSLICVNDVRPGKADIASDADKNDKRNACKPPVRDRV